MPREEVVDCLETDLEGVSGREEGASKGPEADEISLALLEGVRRPVILAAMKEGGRGGTSGVSERGPEPDTVPRAEGGRL